MILISLSLQSGRLSLFSSSSLSYPRLCERTKRDKRDLACLITFPHNKAALSRWEMYTRKDGENTRTNSLSLFQKQAGALARGKTVKMSKSELTREEEDAKRDAEETIARLDSISIFPDDGGSDSNFNEKETRTKEDDEASSSSSDDDTNDDLEWDLGFLENERMQPRYTPSISPRKSAATRSGWTLRYTLNRCTKRTRRSEGWIFYCKYTPRMTWKTTV